MEFLLNHASNKGSRPELSHFKRVSRRFEGEADFMASLNIRNRVTVNLPIVAEVIFDHLIAPTASSDALARSS